MSGRERVCGLDAIRFIAALWVVLGHVGAMRLVSEADKSSPVVWLLNGIYNNIFSGPAAVIVFFLVSGFCIHYPYAAGQPFVPGSFFLRRYIRIGIPMGVAIAVAQVMGANLALFEDSILWSLVAELIYYTLYPALRMAFARFGLDRILALSFVGALAVIATDPGAKNYPSYGWQLNWLLGLPCWLLGVRLAALWSAPGHTRPFIGTAAIWQWRLGVWGLAALCSVLRFHSPIGYPWSLSAFALMAYLWLDREVARGFNRLPYRALEWAGTWSYSVYLFHLLAYKLYLTYTGVALDSSPATWLMGMGFILVSCYVFFLLFEQRSHVLARALSRAYLQRLGAAQRSGSGTL